MNINELLKKLKKDDKVFKLAILYLKVTKKEKEALLEMYSNSNKDNIIDAIENAIYADTETFDTMKKIIDAQVLANGDIPTFKETSEVIKNQMPEIDSTDLKKFIEENRKR